MFHRYQVQASMSIVMITEVVRKKITPFADSKQCVILFAYFVQSEHWFHTIATTIIHKFNYGIL